MYKTYGFLKHRNWNLFCLWWKGTTLYPGGIWREVLQTSNVTRKQESAYSKEHCLHPWCKTAQSVGHPHSYRSALTTNTPNNNVANATVQLRSPSALCWRRPQTSASAQPSLPSIKRMEFQKLISHSSRQRTGPSATGTGQNWDSRLPKPLIAA